MDFTAGKLSFIDMLNQYKAAPNLLLYASPLMLLFVFIEYYIGQRKNLNLYSRKDFVASVSIGAIYLVVTAITGILTIYTVWAVYYYMTPPALLMGFTWWAFLLCLIVYDFCRYWAHRIAHEQRFWWASHITHHSSEHYNFTVSFRLCWIDQVKLIFFLPVVLLGFDPIMFFIVHQIGVLYQFWQHTELIPKMPAWVEYVFVTPTNHKIHHGKNESFIDKNYGSTFIIWDRIFGTYQEPSEKPVYGVTTPPGSFNPAYLVFHEYIDIIKDLKYAKTWKDRRRIVFGRPGSFKRPIEQKETVVVSDNTEQQEEESVHILPEIR
jgi:sterol desaturase/sphingolipid hydroxylase (fatty acid hydroxylase superfamily)